MEPWAQPNACPSQEKCASPSTAVEVDRSRLDAINQDLAQSTTWAVALGERLEKAMDYVVGAVPPCPACGVEAGAVVGGMIGHTLDQLQALYRALDHLDDNVRRLERVVG